MRGVTVVRAVLAAIVAAGTLAGCAGMPDIKGAWDGLTGRLPPGTKVVSERPNLVVTLVSNQENTEFASLEEGAGERVPCGKGKFIKIAVDKSKNYELWARPDGYRERHLAVPAPLPSSVRFTFEISDREQEVARPPWQPPLPEGGDTASIALVIGIEDYLFMGEVPGCVTDAEEVASAICRVRGLSRQNVVLMTDSAVGSNLPTRGAIERRLETLASEVAEDGLFFIYFSGHGATRDGDLYLIARDEIETGGIALSSMVARLENSKARDKVLVLDCCRASAEKGPEKIVPPVGVGKDVAVFLSCGEGEKSYPVGDGAQSLYTRCFLRALGQMTGDGRQRISASALQNRIGMIMRQLCIETGRKQTPQLIAPDSDVTVVPARRGS